MNFDMATVGDIREETEHQHNDDSSSISAPRLKKEGYSSD